MSNYIPLIINIAIGLLLAVFLYRDSRARDYNWVLWTLLPVVTVFTAASIFFASFFQLAILVLYLILRPKGALTKCPKCGKKILNILTICPFCRKDAKRECLNCHEPVDWEADQCPFCKSRNLTKG
ncbi:MAG TPA: hypothetical protein VHY08_27240 [Bacillota bacterium]|nr:hypothetical protein [Bacillota bacterium]